MKNIETENSGKKNLTLPWHKSLKFRLTMNVVLMAVFLGVLVMFLLHYFYQDRIYDEFRNRVSTISKITASLFEGEEIDGYLSSLEKDAAYEHNLARMRVICEEAGITYLTVSKILENGEIFVFDTDESEDQMELGEEVVWDEDEYIEEIAALYFEGRRVDPFAQKTRWGTLLTANEPILRQDETTAAYASASIYIDDILRERNIFFLLIGAFITSVVVIFVVFNLFIIKRFVVSPVGALVKIVADYSPGAMLANAAAPAIRSGDEFEILEGAILEMELRTDNMTLERERMSARIEAMINNLPGMVFQHQYDPPEYTYTFVSAGCEELTGYTSDELCSKKVIFSGMMHPDERENMRKMSVEKFSSNSMLEASFRITTKNGETKWIWARSRVLEKNPDGTPRLIEGYYADISERQQLKATELVNRAKSVFLANMSHELRTPLNVIIGLTDLTLEENQISKHVFDNLCKISNAGSVLLSIVNDILDFSKIESGKLKLIPVNYYLPSLLNDIITLTTTLLGEKPVTFQLNISDDLPSKLHGDDLRIKQILNNLLSNAVKYTHTGTIELTVSCAREGEKDVWMEISVSDTGVGIGEEDLKNIFMDYSQVENRANRKIEGTGLGLSIVKRLAEMMDGEVHVESEHGKGSVFSVRIRQIFISDEPIGAITAQNLRDFLYTDDKRIVSQKLVRPDLSYARVLVVDDMQTNLDVAESLLRKYKMQVDCVKSGREAVERIRLGKPVYNAIFMDHMMPEMDGIEATDNIRALDLEYARTIPIIALTANAIHGTENIFYLHDFQAFITKPIDIMLLDSVVRKWIRNELVEKEISEHKQEN